MAGATIIREARPQELAGVEDLVKVAYREFRDLMPVGVWQRWMDNIGEALHAPGGIVLVAVEAGVMVGAVTFFSDAAQSHQGDWPPGAAAIRMLAVSPARRGRGYGRRLTQAALDRARKLGISTIYLYTGTFMTAARRLYEHLDFQRAKEFDGHPGPIAYRLDLV
jgi:ribosomal protein S18 acetylase RimI-like enzyme